MLQRHYLQAILTLAPPHKLSVSEQDFHINTVGTHKIGAQHSNVMYHFGGHSLYPIYSSSHKSCMFCFAQLLLQMVTYQNQGKFWNLLVLRIQKLSLKVKFDFAFRLFL